LDRYRTKKDPFLVEFSSRQLRPVTLDKSLDLKKHSLFFFENDEFLNSDFWKHPRRVVDQNWVPSKMTLFFVTFEKDPVIRYSFRKSFSDFKNRQKGRFSSRIVKILKCTIVVYLILTGSETGLETGQILQNYPVFSKIGLSSSTSKSTLENSQKPLNRRTDQIPAFFVSKRHDPKTPFGSSIIHFGKSWQKVYILSK
jgi:hypothetical protein